jgi:hypothetical protein
MRKKKNKINAKFGHTQGFEEQINDGRVAKKRVKNSAILNEEMKKRSTLIRGQPKES